MRHGQQTPTFRFLFLSLLGLFALLFFLARAPSFAISPDPLPSFHPIQDYALQAALEALQNNRLEEALSDLTAAEREQPSNARIRNFRGIVLVRMGRASEAADEYREATRLDPSLEDAYKNLGFLE